MAEKIINGRTFKVQRMLATQALILQGRLLKAFGPAISKLGELLKARDDENGQAQAAMGALGEVFARLDPYEYAGLVGDIIKVAQIQRANGQYMPADLDGDFSESPGDILPIVFMVLQEQFGDFFKGLPGAGNLGSLIKG